MKSRGLIGHVQTRIAAQIAGILMLADGDTPGLRFLLGGETAGPNATGRSIEQIARKITASYGANDLVDLNDSVFDAFIKNFADNVYGQEIYVDRNHKPEDGVQGKVERIFKDGDRLLMEMSWTPEGVRTFSEKGFRYFSIEYHPNYQNKETKQLHGPVLQGVAMVPRPFIKNMQPSAGPGRLLLSEGRSFFVPDYLNLPQGDPMKKFLKLLKAALEAKKLSATVVGILLAQAQHEAEAKKLSEDAEGEFDKLRTHFEVVGAKLAEDKDNLETAKVEPGKMLTADDVAAIVAKQLEAKADSAKKLAETETSNRKLFTDAIDAAKGLSDGTKELLKKQSTAIAGSMNVDQVKSLSDAAIELGNQSEVAAQKFRLGLTQAGPAGRVGGTVVVVDGGIGSQVHALMREKLLLSDSAANLTLPEEKSLSGFARKTLAIFDQIHAKRLDDERKMLADDGSTNIADGQFPVAVQRQVIVELLADMAVMALVQTLTDPNAQFTTQIPYEERNVANIRNGAVTYEGQGIARAGVTQKMDNAYITPRKLALMLSNEMIHFSRASLINWDAWARNIASNARLMKDIMAVAIMNELQRSADAFGALDVTAEVITAQVDGTETVFKTAQFPIVRPKQVKDLQGTNVGTAENAIALVYNGGAIPMWDGTGKQSAGTYYHVVDWNQGLFSFVDETGAVQAKASQTTTISYSYATNVVKYDIDLPADTDADVHYNALLDLFGDSKAYLQQNRYVDVQFALMATTLHNTITKAKRFEANSQKAGTGLNSDGDLERVKAVPCFSSNQPGADMAEGRIILGQRNTLSYVIAKPFVTGTPFEAVNSDGEPTGQKVAYGEEYSAVHVPSPIRNRMRSIIVYSATARAAI